VFGFAYLFSTIIGAAVVIVFKKVHSIHWKLRMAMTWCAFFLCNSILAGIISGLLFFNNFGIVVQWMIGGLQLMGIVAGGVLFMMIMTRPYWAYMFFKSTPSGIFMKDPKTRDVYIQNVFLKSWFFGSIVLMFFNWPMLNLFWPIFLLSLGIITVPLFKLPPLLEAIRIKKTEKNVFNSRRPFYFLIGLLVVVRVIGSLAHISF